MAIPQTQFDVFAFNRATAAPLAGDEANITAELRKDYSTFVATTDVNPTPVSGKPGFYRFDLTAGERDVELELRIFPESATNGIEVIGVPMFYATASALAGASVNVLPAVGISADRSPGVVLRPFVGETISQSITLYQTDGTTPIVLTGKSLEMVFETRSGTDVSVIANASIVVSGDDDNVVTFSYPSAVTLSERVLRFSLRDDAAPATVYLTGICKVAIAPGSDPA